MKKLNTYLLILSSLLLVFACTRYEEVESDKSIESKIKVTFHASVTETDQVTKTLIDGKAGDKFRSITWLPEDAIAVMTDNGLSTEKFQNIKEESGKYAVFEGTTAAADRYYALFPYQEDAYMQSGVMNLTLPSVQEYKEGTFGQEAMPMVADVTRGDSLYFKNICGGFVVNLLGTETISSVRFSGKDQNGNPLATNGSFCVNMDFDTVPEIYAKDNIGTSTTLNCGTGVQLKTEVATPFHFVLPPATYYGFTITIITADGKIMIKETDKALTIKRANITNSAAFTFEANLKAENLSRFGTANCYIVPVKSSTYCFDAVKGNSNMSVGYPVTAEVLWETKNSGLKVNQGDIISHVSLAGDIVTFSTSFEPVAGNAVIGVKDADGNILWSWHIWVVDFDPEATAQTYISGAVMMDRNLGAVSVTPGEVETYGMLYQWGRKDPLPGLLDESSTISTYPEDVKTYVNDINSLNYIIQHPTEVTLSGTWNNNDSALWDSEKTIYDPCPVGWKVPDGAPSVWDGAVQERAEGGYYINPPYSVPAAYYPGTGYITQGTTQHMFVGSAITCCTCTQINNQQIYSCHLFFDVIDPDRAAHKLDQHPVRCTKDEGYDLPKVTIIEVQSTGLDCATLSCEVTDKGSYDVTERGLLWGTTDILSIETGNVIKCDAGVGEFTAEITGLQPSSKYYCRAYAINASGISYSPVISFYTLYDGSEINLSTKGTANCYTVPCSAGSYAFDATVKGNSDEAIGSPCSAEVLWQTRHTEGTTNATILEGVNLKGRFVTFNTNGTPGNALIAVKDAFGTILWSWHIWVTDTPEDHIYIGDDNSHYIVMDRNLGATRADKGAGDEWKQSRGTVYQWGRKDPFIDKIFSKRTWNGVSDFSTEESIQNPTKVSVATGSFYISTDWSSDGVKEYWKSGEKTIYDPCPPGYRVADNNIWSDFTSNSADATDMSQINSTGKFDNGWNFLYDGINTAWYPATIYFSHHSANVIDDGSSYLWSSEYERSMFFTDMELLRNHSLYDVNSVSVRCMSERSINFKVKALSATYNKENHSTTITGEVVSDTQAMISEKGFVWSCSGIPDISKNDGKHISDMTSDEFSHTITDLKSGKIYSIRAYAICSDLVVYSKPVFSMPPPEGSNEGITEDEYEW